MGHLATIVGASGRHEEAAVISELRAGSEEAFAWLIGQFHQPVYSLLARTIHDPADASDLTQEVFLKVFRGINTFHGDSSLRTWIYRIALHEASNRRRWWGRHKGKEVAIEDEVSDNGSGAQVCIGETLADQQPSPFDCAASSEVKSRVEAALREVPEPFRTALVLRDIEGLSYEECAEVLGTQLGTVKSRLMRGRAALKVLLQEWVSASHTNGRKGEIR
jgi:RNA polymerase sigma-70 factor (ECF subfamily)